MALRPLLALLTLAWAAAPAAGQDPLELVRVDPGFLPE